MHLRGTGILACVGVAAMALAADSLTPDERRRNIDSFEYIWKTVRDKHWDPRINGLDWQAVHDELLPRIEKAGTMPEAREAISAMLDRLHQTHFGIAPAALYGELEASGSADGNPGIDVRILDRRALVTSVDAGSPAAARGVKPGWQIVSVGDSELAPALDRLRGRYEGSTLLELVQSRAVANRLAGPAGSTVKVGFRDGHDRATTLDLDRARPRGVAARLGYFPPMYFWAESRKLPPGVGYLRFNLFFEPDALVGTIRELVAQCRDASGMVIDLRGNPGGIGGLAMGVAGWFVDKPGLRLGTMYLRDATINFVVFARPEPFRGPLAILVDGCSASTAEIFAGGMKDLGRARIFGTRTAGAALPSVFEKLPNGDGFQYAIANYVSEGGKPLEGNGVTPDEEVRPTRAQLLAGRDPVLDAALSWIQKQKH
jgi:carboxyl-terminal processing protease